ncbi:MAG: tetratricopeptide repeat protein [Deferribacteraceae bacterium]|jgi:tetratricopeptide (TPR) repeat protein|nr:tetratricopeptide repeat protein [Deferribacteraceae bacterium]
MNTRLLLSVFTALLILLSAAWAYASQEDDMQRAGSLLRAGKNEEAYRILMNLFRGDPDNETINLALAGAALSANHPNQAVMAFENLLEKHPDNRTFLNGISKAYMAIGDEKTARYYQESAAKSESAANILNRFEARGALRFGGIYDSNANQGPESNTLKLGDYYLTLHDAKQESSYAAYFGGTLDLSYRLASGSPWRITGELGVNARYYFSGKLEDAEREFSGSYWGAAGVRGVFSSRLLEVRAKSEIYDYDFYQTVYVYGGELMFIQALKQRFHLITSLSGAYRNYIRNEDYSGGYGAAGEYLRVFFGNSFHSVTIGGRYMFGSAESEAFSCNGWEGSISAHFYLPYGFSVSPRGSYGEEYYGGAATILDKDDRRDSRITGGITVNYAVTERFSAEMGWHYIRAVSNSELYDYGRHTLSAGAGAKF